MVGGVGWGVIFGLMLAWEGLALITKGWPTISDMFRAVTHGQAGRFMLFAVWLWFGWHLFVRGWAFFLRGPGPPLHVAKPSAETAGRIAQQIVFPLLAVYVVVLALILIAARAIAAGHRASRGGGWARFARHVVVTAFSGYGLLVAAMAAYTAVANQSWTGLFGELARDGAFLSFVVAVPAFLVMSLLQELWHGRSHDGAAPGGSSSSDRAEMAWRGGAGVR